MNTSTAAIAYKATKNQAAIDDASPHTLVAMLIDGALERIAEAKGALERIEQAGEGASLAIDVAVKGEAIGKAIGILDNLRVSLEHERGGEIAENLSRLYDYMTRRLLEANATSDADMLVEVAGLIKEVRVAWSQIPAEMHHLSD